LYTGHEIGVSAGQPLGTNTEAGLLRRRRRTAQDKIGIISTPLGANPTEPYNQSNDFIHIDFILRSHTLKLSIPAQGPNTESVEPNTAQADKQGFDHLGVQEFLAPESSFYGPTSKHTELKRSDHFIFSIEMACEWHLCSMYGTGRQIQF
jgi:hypothetical protein